MNHQTFSDVSARIGALELGAINSFDDATLEAVALHANMQPSFNGICKTAAMYCPPRIDDSALEATVHAVMQPPTQFSIYGCQRIEDGALENTATRYVGPQTLHRLPNGLCL